MIRLMGVLTGSALGIGLLLLVLGVPELAGPPPVADEPDLHDTTIAQSPPVAAVPPADAVDTPAVEDPQPATAATSVAEAVTEAEGADPEPAPLALLQAVTDPGADSVTDHTPAESEPAAQNWYAFWSPFRSRIAADGFILELSRTTGLDYRVVKLKPGVYEVAVAYTDDADIEDKLTRIAMATGLDMSGG